MQDRTPLFDDTPNQPDVETLFKKYLEDNGEGPCSEQTTHMVSKFVLQVRRACLQQCQPMKTRILRRCKRTCGRTSRRRWTKLKRWLTRKQRSQETQGALGREGAEDEEGVEVGRRIHTMSQRSQAIPRKIRTPASQTQLPQSQRPRSAVRTAFQSPSIGLEIDVRVQTFPKQSIQWGPWAPPPSPPPWGVPKTGDWALGVGRSGRVLIKSNFVLTFESLLCRTNLRMTLRLGSTR